MATDQGSALADSPVGPDVAGSPPPAGRAPARWAILAVLFGIAGVGWRLWLAAGSTPPTNSDEAVMGIIARRLAQGRGVSAYYYGQHYMGTIEAFLSAPLVALSGPSVFALRLPTFLLYILFLVLMYALVRRLFSPGLAALTVGLLSLGADRIVKNELIAGGGYPETAPMVAGLLLLTWWLATHPRPRWYATAAWGLLLGLITWNHWLPAPFLVGAVIVLVTANVLDRRTGPAIIGGFLVGVSPLLIDNLQAGAQYNSISVFLGLNTFGSDAPLADRVVGGGWVGLPMGMGLCAPSRCAWWSLWWSPIAVILLLLATGLAVRGIRGADRSATRMALPERVKPRLHLVLAAGGLLTLLSYVRSPAAADTPIESARYLSTLAISLPVMLWPLWCAARRARVGKVVAATVIGALAATMAMATIRLADEVPRNQSLRGDQNRLIQVLRDARLTYVHGEYWTCNWVVYLSAEAIGCGVVADDLGPGFNRIPGQWQPRAQALITSNGTDFDRAMRQRHPTVTPVLAGRYHVYIGEF